MKELLWRRIAFDRTYLQSYRKYEEVYTNKSNYMYTYIYMYKERERERETETDRDKDRNIEREREKEIERERENERERAVGGVDKKWGRTNPGDGIQQPRNREERRSTTKSAASKKEAVNPEMARWLQNVLT